MTTNPTRTILPLEARVALEWFFAAGERTEERLRSLVTHQCFISATDPDTAAEIERLAVDEWRTKGLTR